jgi:hypothetical protein
MSKVKIAFFTLRALTVDELFSTSLKHKKIAPPFSE